MKVWMRLRAAGSRALPAASMSPGAQRASAAITGRRTSVATRRTDSASSCGRDREAGLDDVHAQGVELTSQLQLLLDAHREAGRLLTVAEGGVEDDDRRVGHGWLVDATASERVSQDYNLYGMHNRLECPAGAAWIWLNCRSF